MATKSLFKNKAEAEKHKEYCQTMLDAGLEPAYTVKQWLANYRAVQARLKEKEAKS